MVLLLDASGSIGQQNFRTAIKFTQDLVGDLDIERGTIKFSLVTFSDSPKVQVRLGEFSELQKREMIEAIGKTEYNRGSTNAAEAIR